METVGAAFFDGEWENLSKMFTCEENADFMLQFHGNDGFLNDQENGMMFLQEEANIVTDDCFFFPQQCFSQESSFSSGGNSFPSPIYDQSLLPNNLVQPESMGFFSVDQKNIDNYSPSVPVFCPDEVMGAAIVDSDNKLQHQMKRKSEEEHSSKNDSSSSENPKKKPRVSRHAQKDKKAALPKSKKSPENGNEDRKAQTTSCSSSDHQDESNASQDLITETPNSNSSGKTRATRGAATDPQSLYARRRRERINERLRILQNLVPNGTKVDISTMLEEAVQYVKFLQLQIKLLSSEDLWMYAPIAYNGMDIGIYQKMLPSL